MKNFVNISLNCLLLHSNTIENWSNHWWWEVFSNFANKMPFLRTEFCAQCWSLECLTVTVAEYTKFQDIQMKFSYPLGWDNVLKKKRENDKTNWMNFASQHLNQMSLTKSLHTLYVKLYSWLLINCKHTFCVNNSIEWPTTSMNDQFKVLRKFNTNFLSDEFRSSACTRSYQTMYVVRVKLLSFVIMTISLKFVPKIVSQFWYFETQTFHSRRFCLLGTGRTSLNQIKTNYQLRK